MTLPTDTARRRFLMWAGGVVMLPAAGSLLHSSSARAAGPVKLDEADPAAAALGYKTNTMLVDAVKYPKHQPTQVCAGCRYYQARRDTEWGPCAIFAGKGAVHSNGWCAAYAPR